MCSWRLSRVAQKKENCGKSDLRSTIALLASAEMQKGDSISARLTGAALAEWTERNNLDFVSLLLVNADDWDQTRGPDLGKAGIGFEWDQLIWRTMQPDIRFGNRLRLVNDHSDWTLEYNIAEQHRNAEYVLLYLVEVFTSCRSVWTLEPQFFALISLHYLQRVLFCLKCESCAR